MKPVLRSDTRSWLLTMIKSVYFDVKLASPYAFALVALLAVVGCHAPAVPLDATAVAPLTLPAFDRHDKYVTADASLTEAERADFLRDTKIARAIITESLAKSTPPAEAK